MTDLTAALFAIGGAIVAGVIGYNKWQEHKAKKSVQRAFSTEHDDVLMGQGGAAGGEAAARHEPVFAPENPDGGLPEGGAEIEPAASGALPADLPVDDVVDCIIPLEPAAPLRGEKIFMPLQTLRHAGSKPVNFIGQRADGEWEAISRAGTYAKLRAGVQLASRSGALNELEYSELIASLRRIGDEIDAEPEVPDMTQVMRAARALQQFVTEYDAKLSVNIASKGAPWSITTLLAALARQGFDLRPDGRLVMPDGDGDILFAISTNVGASEETTSRLTLLLDVPRVAQAREGYGAMVACARMLASRLDGTIVDDSDQPLSDATLRDIGGQVEAFYADMKTAEIPAGSTRALRLFS
jgi:hypothetical protein